MITFYVPPGIGDFSAMYSKLCMMDREIEIRPSNDSPNRLGPFLDVLTKVKNGGNASHGANQALNFTLAPGTDLASLEDGEYFLAINEWLEQGGKVADWVPGKTEYHFLDSANMKSGYAYTLPFAWDALKFFSENVHPEAYRVGIYCSAYGNSRHWGFWLFDKWAEFIHNLAFSLPKNTEFFLIGAEYDVAIAEVLHDWMLEHDLKSHLLLGAFHIGGTIELIRGLDYFFSFPSGLGFLADVLNTPNMMWFPPNLSKMMYTFVDPANVNQKTLHVPFEAPMESYFRWKAVGPEMLEEQWLRRKKKS